MRQIDTISSIEGRALLSKIYQEFRYEKQYSNFSTILLCWKICTQERELFRYLKEKISVVHPLGLIRGTALWLEEIINRYYFSTINSFVYFGAAILLALIGIRRFSDSVDNSIVIAGIAFEALMLLFMFFVMLFTPNEIDTSILNKDKEKEDTSELIIEIGEIGRDFAAAVVKMEQIETNLHSIFNQQGEYIKSIEKIAINTSQAVAPNPKLIEIMDETNKSLEKFRMTVEKLNSSAELLKQQEIESAVRREVEKLLMNKMSKYDNEAY